MKNLFLILAVISACLASSYAESVSYGKREDGDRLVFETKVARGPKLDWNTSENVQYPGLGGQEPDESVIITAVEITDNANNGARAAIVNGGPGHYNVLIYFESARSKGYDFDLKIYAK